MFKNNKLFWLQGNEDQTFEDLYDIFNQAFDEIGCDTYRYEFKLDIDAELYDEEEGRLYNELGLYLLDKQKDEIIADITFRDYAMEPTLVYVEGEFQFYYVFSLHSNTYTNPYTYKNFAYNGHGTKPIEVQILEKIMW